MDQQNAPRPRRTAIFVEASALVLVGVGFLTAQLLVLPTKFVGPDTWKYLQIAGKQAQEGFWSDPSAFDHNYWPIGYPTFLAIQFNVVGEDTRGMLIVQALMALALVLVAWGLAYRLGRSHRLAAAALVALSPAVWAMARIGGYEILLALLLCLSLLSVWIPFSTGRCTRIGRLGIPAFASGILLGAATLVQNKAIVVLPVLVFVAWRISRPQAFLPVLGVLVPLLPWAFRNFRVFGSATPFNNNGPINVWIGNNPDATTGGFMEPPPLPPGTSGPLDAAIKFVLSQPEAAFALTLRRLVRLLEPTYVYFEQIPTTMNVVVHYASIFLTLAVVLLFLTYVLGRVWRVGSLLPDLNPLAAFVILYYLVHLPFLAEPRYMSPMAPIMIVTAVATFGALMQRWSVSRQQAIREL